LLFAATLLAARADAGSRTSCPLTTTVVPFESSVSARYEVALTDGGQGDLDGVANGSCLASIRVCRGETTRCEPMTLVSSSVRASGRSTRAARDAAEQVVAEAFDGLASTGDACRVARVPLAAKEDASILFSFRTVSILQSNGRRTLRRHRIVLRCRPPSAEHSGEADCFSARRECPPLGQPFCGNGAVDQASERCDGHRRRGLPRRLSRRLQLRDRVRRP
jgi:hypothetical protein